MQKNDAHVTGVQKEVLLHELVHKKADDLRKVTVWKTLHKNVIALMPLFFMALQIS